MTKSSFDGKSLLIIALTALIPVSVLHLGYTGSDFEFHTGSWLEFLEVLRSGSLVPVWAPHANFGFGEPRFLFYPPLSFVLGAAWTAILPYFLVPQAFVWSVLVLAGLSMLKLAGLVLDRRDALFAALLYMTGYYLLVSILLRFAAAEALAAALAPLAVSYFLRVMLCVERRAGVWLAVCLALQWMTNAPAAVSMFYLFSAAALVVFARQRNWRPLLLFALAEMGGVALSAWYLLPALAGKTAIASGVLLQTNWRKYLLFVRPPAGFWFLLHYPLWLWATACGILTIVAATALAAKSETRSPLRAGLLFTLAALAGAALLGQTVLAAPLWAHLPQLNFVQFPFRFDTLLGCAFPVAFLATFRTRASRWLLCAAWVLGASLPMATRWTQARHHHETTTIEQVRAGVEHGYGGIGEYMPPGLDTPGLAVSTASHAVPIAQSAECKAFAGKWTPQEHDFHQLSGNGCEYVVGAVFYPFWHERVDGVAHDEWLHRSPHGLIRMQVPPGTHDVTLVLERPQRASMEGLLLTLLAAVCGLWLYRRSPAAADGPCGASALRVN